MPTFWLKFRLIGVVLIFVSAILPVSDSKSDNVRICVSANPNIKGTHTVKNCDQLARSKKTHATCIFASDRLQCLQLLSDRKADMTVLEVEDLLFATFACPSPCNVLVVSEIRLLQKNPYETKGVVLVRTDANVKPDLRGARLCHPGWVHQDGRSTLFAQYLEERLAPQSCSANLSLLEDRLRSSAAYFGPSCKPGSWSPDKEEDARLKATYPNLCAACDNPTACSTSDKYWGSGGAATCLKDGAGDAMWTTYADVRLFFKLSLPGEEASKYRFLCLDGTTQPLNETEPCIWLARPWQVVVANSKMATEVQKALALIGDDNHSDWEDSLLSVFEAHKEYIVNLEVAKPPEDYLDTIPGNEMTLSNCNPRHEVTWCTASGAAYRKCMWISQAAAAFSVAPAISCEQRISVTKCLQAVEKLEADVTVVPADYQPQAILHHKLQALFYEDFKVADGGYNLVAITTRPSPIKRLSDLRSRRACFTLHQGLAWRAAVVALRSQNLISSSCSATHVLHDYFSEVCVVTGGADDGLPLCCGTEDRLDPDVAAFRCLMADGCDVAFVKNSTLYTDGNNTSPLHDFRLVCPDEKQECSWASSTPSAIMAATNLPLVRFQEARHLFSEISRLFMRRNKGKSLAVAVFGPFHDESNVLFQDSSTDLTPADRYMEHKSASSSLQDVLNATRYCSDAPRTSCYSPLLLLLLLITLFRR